MSREYFRQWWSMFDTSTRKSVAVVPPVLLAQLDRTRTWDDGGVLTYDGRRVGCGVALHRSVWRLERASRARRSGPAW